MKCFECVELITVPVTEQFVCKECYEEVFDTASCLENCPRKNKENTHGHIQKVS